MVDTSKMIRERNLVHGPSEVGLDLKDLAHEAREYLESQQWCVSVNDVFYDRGFPKVAVFLANITPFADADPQVWVVVGDLPPLFLDIEDHSNGAEALAGYVLVYYYLLHLYKKHESLDEVPPVLRRGSLIPMEMTDEVANMLRSRLLLVKKMILELWRDDLRIDIGPIDEDNVA